MFARSLEGQDEHCTSAIFQDRLTLETAHTENPSTSKVRSQEAAAKRPGSHPYLQS